jgi:hypothetical protein
MPRRGSIRGPQPSDRNQPHRSNQRRGVRSVQSEPSTRNRRFSYRLPSQPPAAVARATHPAARDSTANIQSIPKQEENCPSERLRCPSLSRRHVRPHGSGDRTPCPIFSLLASLSPLGSLSPRWIAILSLLTLMSSWRDEHGPARCSAGCGEIVQEQLGFL